MKHGKVSTTLALTIAVTLASIGCTDPQLVVCALIGGTWQQQGLGFGCAPPSPKSAAASPGEALFISAAAHQAGAQGTNWRSDIEIHNLGTELGVFEVLMLEHGEDNTVPETVELSLAAGQSVRLADVLQGEFNTDGAAALILIPSFGRIVATSRTYNLLGPGNALGLPAGATFGQFVPALPISSAIQDGEEGRIIQLSHSSGSAGGARANLGLVNATVAELAVRIELFNGDGLRLGVVNRTLEPLEYEQINRIYERVTVDDVDDGYAVVSTTTPGGSFFAYASVVDNLTGDPVAILAERLPGAAPAGPGDPVYVVAASHATGAAGTNWRTDLEVHCTSDGPAEFTIEVLEHGVNNSDPMSRNFVLESQKSIRLNDVLWEEFSFEGAAALRVTPSRGRVLVTSRTYNLLGAGNDLGLPPGATFGQFIQGVTDERAIARGEHGRLIQLAQSTDDQSGFRTNLVLVNAVAEPIDVVIDLYESDGVFLGTVDRTLKPYEYRQLNRVFTSVTSAAVEDGFAVVRTVTEGGRVFALASVVDNLTGDPVGMAAPVILSPQSEEVLSSIGGVVATFGQVGLEGVVDHAQDVGVGGLVDAVVSGLGDVATATGSGMAIDYGTGWTAPDGTVYSGSIDVDTSGLSIGSGGIEGTMTITNDGYLVDGEPPSIGGTSWTFDLTERADGSVVGNVTVGSSAKSLGSMSGTIGIDTEICLDYPISGSLTTVVENEVITITFGPECDGSIGRSVEPSDIFSYDYGDPAGPSARDYIVSVSNAEVGIEGSAHYWRPIMGAEEFVDTEPGVITYHFPFDRPIVSGHLYATLAVWHFWYSRGHAFLYGSTDGEDWELLVEAQPPELDQGRGANWNGDLPEMFIGETDIWLQGRLYSYGPKAASGGIYCNTAEMSRWDANGPATSFELEVELE